MPDTYEVLNPWAEADPILPKGISPRINDLNGKKIGLFRNSKIAARPTLEMVKEKLKQRFSRLEFSYFEFLPNDSIAESKDITIFENWVKGLDAVILAHGD